MANGPEAPKTQDSLEKQKNSSESKKEIPKYKPVKLNHKEDVKLPDLNVAYEAKTDATFIQKGKINPEITNMSPEDIRIVLLKNQQLLAKYFPKVEFDVSSGDEAQDMSDIAHREYNKKVESLQKELQGIERQLSELSILSTNENIKRLGKRIDEISQEVAVLMDNYKETGDSF